MKTYQDFKIKCFWNKNEPSIVTVRVSLKDGKNPRLEALDHASNMLFQADENGKRWNPLTVAIIDSP